MSTSTATPLVTIDAAEPLEKILNIIARDGGVIVSNFLEPNLLAEVRNAGRLCQVNTPGNITDFYTQN
jgi:hypothetical protein